ncbi:MAG: hypothetical protein GY754_43825 [bacterium]|nr:hypothetical protein [bacterium]
MERSKIVVVSDIHMSNGASYSWFKDSYPGYFQGMLEMITGDDQVKELVLLGDFFDLWLYAVDDTPFQFNDIINMWDTTIIEPLKNCISALPNVYYLNGNHDMQVTKEEAESITSGDKHLQWTTPEIYNAKYKGLLHLEHGNSVDMFNAPDPSSDTVNGLPLGYFITRLAATANDQDKSRNKLLEILEPQYKNYLSTNEFGIGKLLVETVIDGLMLFADIKGEPVTNDTEIVFPDPSHNVTIGTVKEHYHSLLGTWAKKGISNLWGYMTAALLPNGLDWYAKGLLEEEAAKVVVLGHTHHGEYQVYSGDPYGNCGCWCKSSDKEPTYIEIDMQASEIIVTLKQWVPSSGSGKEIEVTRIPL